MLYADDLSLTANEPGQLQMMLDRLSAYALRKGLIVNTSKSEVVHFNFSTHKGTCVQARRVAASQQRLFLIPWHDLHQDTQHGCCSRAYAYAFHGWLP